VPRSGLQTTELFNDDLRRAVPCVTGNLVPMRGVPFEPFAERLKRGLAALNCGISTISMLLAEKRYLVYRYSIITATS